MGVIAGKKKPSANVWGCCTEIFDEISEDHFQEVRYIHMYRVYSTILHRPLLLRPHIDLMV